MMNAKRAVSAFLMICSSSAFAGDYAWIIGGGPKKESSEIQIERNVQWASEVIQNKSTDPVLSIFYTDGDDPEPDVVDFVDRDKAGDEYVLNMIFSGTGFHPAVYSNHTITSHAGTTHPDNLVPALTKDFSELKEGDSAMILYNGHGWGSSSDHGLSTLRLWKEKGLTAYDFEKLLSNIDEKVPVRFILTQCFSGGFSGVIHPNTRDDTMELKGNRCGFMAESATREAEGCSASLTVGEYRDYTTFMFAALDGKTRLGAALDYNPDINGDGTVSFHEAHLYTLASAYSTDLSRSTTEYYLEKWEPWYLRWLPADKRSKDSIFYQLMVKVAGNNQILPEAAESPSELRAERIKRMDRFESLQADMEKLKKKIKSSQGVIIAELEKDYPGVTKAYKDDFKGYSDKLVSEIKGRAIHSDKLAELKRSFDEKDRLDHVLLDAERALTQVEKIARLKKLAKLDALFPVFASSLIRENYNQLLSCEEGFL